MLTWNIKKLGNVCEFFNGQAHENCIVENGKYKVINSKFIASEGLVFKQSDIALSPLFKNDIVMVMSDVPNGKALAKCFLVDEDDTYTLNQRICVIRSNSFYPRFLYYQLNRHKYFLSFDNGENQTNLRKNDILNCDLFVPPLPEQQRIVSILDKAFAAIDKAKTNAQQNLNNVKELFESYLQSIFEYKGAGWEEKTLGDVCEFRNGAAHEQHIDENGKYILVNSKFISADGEKMKRTNSALAPLFVNDIAFVMSDVPKGKALAKCFLIDKNDTYTLNQRIGAINSKVFIPEFLIYQFNRNKYLLSFDNGENQTNLRKGDILECPLFVPSKEQQQTIVHQLDALQDEAQKLEVIYQKKLNDLEELKKSILQKAFSGEL